MLADQYLQDASQDIEGFASEEVIAHQPIYYPPTEEYQTALRCAADTLASSQGDGPISAGFILNPDPENACAHPPIFIAHSLTSALWLVRECLPKDTLTNTQWARLISAANPSTSDTIEQEEEEGEKQAADEQEEAENSREEQEQEQEQEQDQEQEQEAEEGEDDDMSDVMDAAPKGKMTITNKNKAAEKRRATIAMKKRAKRLAKCGLRAPPATAPKLELAAYDSIPPTLEPDYSWIFKQPVSHDTNFFEATDKPYNTASRIIETIRALGNRSSLEQTHAFIMRWRNAGTPFSLGGESLDEIASTAIAVRPSATSRSLARNIATSFARKWEAGDRLDRFMAAGTIQSRWIAASLARDYQREIDRLEAERGPGRSRHGRGKVTSEAKRNLLRSLRSKPSTDAWNTRLKRGNRWYTAAKQLGWGILCLYPSDIAASSWVEQGLRLCFWDVWINLVPRLNPEAAQASQAIHRFLGEQGINGGPIATTAQLLIEQPTWHEVGPRLIEVREEENREELDGEAMDVDDDEGSDQEPGTQAPLSPQAKSSSRGARGRSILELFQAEGE